MISYPETYQQYFFRMGNCCKKTSSKQQPAATQRELLEKQLSMIQMQGSLNRGNTSTLSPYPRRRESYQMEEDRNQSKYHPLSYLKLKYLNQMAEDLKNLDSVPISRSKTGNHSAKIPKHGSMKSTPGPLVPPLGKWSDRGGMESASNLSANRFSQNELYVIHEVSEPSRMISSVPRYTGASQMMMIDHRSNHISDSCAVLTAFNTVSQTGIVKASSYVLNANPHPNIQKRLSAANKRNSYRFSVDRSGKKQLMQAPNNSNGKSGQAWGRERIQQLADSLTTMEPSPISSQSLQISNVELSQGQLRDRTAAFKYAVQTLNKSVPRVPLFWK